LSPDNIDHTSTHEDKTKIEQDFFIHGVILSDSDPWF
jgi:hypothetical protein